MLTALMKCWEYLLEAFIMTFCYKKNAVIQLAAMIKTKQNAVIPLAAMIKTKQNAVIPFGCDDKD